MSIRSSWYGHVAGWAYAISIKASCEREARAELRKFLGVQRLPRGSAVWESSFYH